MTSPQADDVNSAIVRAWRDPEYAASLSPETRDAMPPLPENIDALTDEQLLEIVRDGVRKPLTDEQLSVAAGAGTNGINYNHAYTHALETGSSPSQARFLAQNALGVSASPPSP